VNRVHVTSEMMSSIAYDAATAVLEIEFRSGAVYEYLDVPPDAFDALMLAGSKGRFFNVHVRPLFRFRRVKLGPHVG